MLLLLAALLLDGPKPEPPAIAVRLVNPRAQGERVLKLFDGARAPSPAAALAGYKRAKGGDTGLGKPLDAAISALNPGMVAELRTLDEATLGLGWDATGRVAWNAVVPRDDGTFAAFATAAVLTEGSSDPPLDGLPVDRLGPKATASLSARSPGGFLLAGSRDDLAEALRRSKEPLPASPIDSGWLVHIDAKGLDREGVPLRARRLGVSLAKQGAEGLDAAVRLEGETLHAEVRRPLREPAGLRKGDDRPGVARGDPGRGHAGRVRVRARPLAGGLERHVRRARCRRPGRPRAGEPGAAAAAAQPARLGGRHQARPRPLAAAAGRLRVHHGRRRGQGRRGPRHAPRQGRGQRQAARDPDAAPDRPRGDGAQGQRPGRAARAPGPRQAPGVPPRGPGRGRRVGRPARGPPGEGGGPPRRGRPRGPAVRRLLARPAAVRSACPTPSPPSGSGRSTAQRRSTRSAGRGSRPWSAACWIGCRSTRRPTGRRRPGTGKSDSMRLIDLHVDWLLQYAGESTIFDPAEFPDLADWIGQADGYLGATSAAILACYRNDADWARRADPWAGLEQLVTRIEAEFPGRVLRDPDDLASMERRPGRPDLGGDRRRGLRPARAGRDRPRPPAGPAPPRRPALPADLHGDEPAGGLVGARRRPRAARPRPAVPGDAGRASRSAGRGRSWTSPI